MRFLSIYTFAFDGLDNTIKLFSLFMVCMPFCEEEEDDDDGGGANSAAADDAGDADADEWW